MSERSGLAIEKPHMRIEAVRKSAGKHAKPELSKLTKHTYCCFPAALSNRLNTHTRFFDCQAGALGQRAPHLSMAAGYGTSPHFIFTGYTKDKKYFQLMELLFGGVPGRPRGDGLDGHAWWPLFSATPSNISKTTIQFWSRATGPSKDSGGAGLHRGGAGIEKVYRVLESGRVSIHDDREIVPPWGINGGMFRRNFKQMAGQGRRRKPSADPVENSESRRQFAGDRIIFKTAGSGGWGDPLDRDAGKVARDVQFDLVSTGKSGV